MTGISLIVTDDGSHSLRNDALNETYHSKYGAVRESGHVYIKNGLEYWLQRHEGTARILEVGFGTGLNALLALHLAQQQRCLLKYETLETLPLHSHLYGQLNYPEALGGLPALAESFLSLHQAAWNEPIALSPYFELHKRLISVHDFEPRAAYDVLFFDAFAPSRQPDMWQPQVIQKMFSALAPGGVLATYCAQGQFKHHLKEAGFEVQSLKGPPFKKEMVRALKH